MLRPDELALMEKLPANGCTPKAAELYTKWLATHHYENFSVVSWLLPKELHQHFYNVYAYCRWADDLGDEIPDKDRALDLLNWWETELNECYEGRPSHPVFVALQETVVAKQVPRQPFADLLKAFRQDQLVKRYATWDAVLDYCKYSANPVGRLVLYLCSYRDEERQKLSDATCTGLQLANFWQDVARDLEKGRIYIPLDRAAAHGVTERQIVEKTFNQCYVALMKELIEYTRALFEKGKPLSRMVSGKLSVDLAMFTRGGLAVLDAIQSIGYDTLNHRPEVSKGKQVRLLGRAIVTHMWGGSAPTPITQVQRPLADIAPRREPMLDVVASYEECHRIAREAHSSFYPAFFLLPKPKRDGIVSLYAFMRCIDDVSDEGADLVHKQRALARWRAALDEAITGHSQAFDGNAVVPLPVGYLKGEREVIPALVDTIERYKMPTRYLHDLISGAEMDLTIQSYTSFERLREYCYRVAGTVGLTCTHIFGFEDSKALELAEKLGLAFQLTNIIRDVNEDFELGRVYLPEEDLLHFHVTKEDFARQEASLGVHELLRFEAERAWKFYDEGAQLLGMIDEDSRPTLWLLVHTYSSLLARIESVDFAVFGGRVRLTKAEKLKLVAKARFGRHTKENILAKRDRNRGRARGAVGGRIAG
jgi:squalene synthase HpnC